MEEKSGLRNANRIFFWSFKFVLLSLTLILKLHNNQLRQQGPQKIFLMENVYADKK